MMNEKKLIPIEDAWDTPLIFYIYFEGGVEEYYNIPRDKRREFNKKFKKEYTPNSTSSTVPDISIVRKLCRKYGSFMLKSQFEKLSTLPVGISTTGREGYRKYVVMGYKVPKDEENI